MKIASLIIDIFKGRHTREEVHDIISYYEKQNPNFFVDYDIKKKDGGSRMETFFVNSYILKCRHLFIMTEKEEKKG